MKRTAIIFNAIKRKGIYVSLLSIALCFHGVTARAQKKPPEIIDSLLNDLKTAKEDTTQVWLLVRLSQTYLSINPSQGVPYGYQALALTEKINWEKGKALAENTLGLTIGDSGNNDAARKHYLKAYDINQRIDNRLGMASNLYNVGRTYRRQAKIPEALDYYLKSLALSRELKNNLQIAIIGTGLSAIYAQQGDWARAFAFGDTAVKYGEITHSKVNIAKGLMDKGVAKAAMIDTPAARIYLDQALAIFEEMGDQTNTIVTMSNIATLSYPDYHKAIGIFTKVMRILDKSAPKSVTAVTTVGTLGEAYLRYAQTTNPVNKKWLDSAFLCTHKSIDLASETNSPADLATLYLNLAEIDELKGDYKTAVSDYQMEIKLNDSLYSQDKKNQLAGLEAKYKIDLKDKEISIAKLALGSQRRTQLVLIIGLVLLSVIGGLLLRQSRLRKKSNTTLMVLNNQLDEANKVKSKFFGILSHDLRSPIANLISFLNLVKNDPLVLSPEEQALSQQQISGAAEQLLETMETMLLWSKEQMKHFKPDIRIVEVSVLFTYLEKFFSQSNSVRFSFLNPENLQVSSDENYLKVIMQNLTSNAIKALKNSPDGVIEWKARKVGDKTILSIKDNGPGLNSEQTRSLYLEGSAVNAKTGFGFHLIRDLARAIQYRISIESMPGKGTTFILSA